MSKKSDVAISALVEQILKDPGPIAEEVKYHLTCAVTAHSAGDHATSMLHCQSAKALLAQHTCIACGS
jgi:hypothetical protein